MKKISGIDLFCGIGGLTNGLQQAGIKINAGIDNDITCKYAFEVNNNAKFIFKDITKVTKKDILPFFENDSYKLIAGCAPCQPYSNHQKSKNLNNRLKHTKYGLIMELLRLVQEIKPEFVTMENVPQLLNDPLLQDFISWFKNNGYYINYDKIDVSKYGAPQRRKRFVFVASKLGEIKIPKINKIDKIRTVKEIIGNLPSISAGEKSISDPLHVSSVLSEINFNFVEK